MLVLVDGLRNETSPYCVRMVQIATHQGDGRLIGETQLPLGPSRTAYCAVYVRVNNTAVAGRLVGIFLG
jgi:hypothetical protein